MSTIAADNISNLAGTASTAMNNAINGSAKAWVNFNGTGTVAIRASFNVSSITDNGAGNYTINLTNAMPDIGYSALVSTNIVTAAPYIWMNISSSSSFSVFHYENNAYTDIPIVCAAVFR